MKASLNNLEIDMKEPVKNIKELKALQINPSSRVSFDELANTIAIKSNNFEPVVCDLCDDMFDERWKLEHHMTTKHEARNYTCDKCGKTYYMEWRLKKHMQLHD